MDEEWRPAPSAPEGYEVSSLGRVRNVRTGRIRVTPINSTGYRNFGPYVDGVHLTVSLHREVCRAFNGEPPFADAVVRHLDGDPLNNLPENLSWGTQAENSADQARHGTVLKGGSHPRAKLTESAALEIHRRARPGRGGNTAALAAEYGVHPTHIGRVIAGQQWAHINGKASEADG